MHLPVVWTKIHHCIKSLCCTNLARSVFHSTFIQVSIFMNLSKSIARLASRYQLSTPVARRALATSSVRLSKEQEGRIHPNADGYREDQKSKPEVPHMTNTTSTFNNKMPSVGNDKPPPEFITSVDPNYTPKDKHPENTERMTGGTQSGDPDNVSSSGSSELGVGEMEGASFKVEPLRRTGEDITTMRARLLCPS